MKSIWVPLKIRDFVHGLGKKRRGAGVYKRVHDGAEPIFNDAREQKSNF